tara:strand:- start:569 stop:868 length:300 start_codon:yes stop_codon:yes gene_type:complete
MINFSFKIGDFVKVKDLNLEGHLRTPAYLRDKIGRVELVHGFFKNPEKLAYGKPGLPRLPLYLVEFKQKEVWPDYTGGLLDSISADLYEHWLDCVEVKL